MQERALCHYLHSWQYSAAAALMRTALALKGAPLPGAA